MERERLVIVGNGMAPGRMLEHLFARAPGRFDVTIFNAEPRVNYAGPGGGEDICRHHHPRR
jgi:nitrite reductase (NADH) large subunit